MVRKMKERQISRWKFSLIGTHLAPNRLGEDGLEGIRWAFNMLVVDTVGLLVLVRESKKVTRLQSENVTITNVDDIQLTYWHEWIKIMASPETIYVIIAVLILVKLWLLINRPDHKKRVSEEGRIMHRYDGMTISCGRTVLIGGCVLSLLLFLGAKQNALPGQIQPLETSSIVPYQFSIDKSKGIKLSAKFKILDIAEGTEVLQFGVSIDPILSRGGWYVANVHEEGSAPLSKYNRVRTATTSKEITDKKPPYIEFYVIGKLTEDISSPTIHKGETIRLSILLKQGYHQDKLLSVDDATHGLNTGKFKAHIHLDQLQPRIPE